MKTLVVYVNFQYSAEVDNQVQPANRENFRKRAHGYFYDGQDIGKDDFDPIQVSDIVSKSHDEDKNLWYSRRHSIVERAELNRLFDIKTARSKPFSEIFDVNK